MCSKQRYELQTAADNASPDASPPRPGSTDGQEHRLRRHWLECALASAGIDPSHWDPARGVDANRRTIERVYNNYGRLYEQHARLQRAGIANLIGPSFYAGFLNMGIIPGAERQLVASLRQLLAAPDRWVAAPLRRDRTAERTVDESLGFYEGSELGRRNGVHGQGMRSGRT